MSTISSSTTTTTAYKVTADTTGTLVLQTGATPTTAVTVGTDQSVTFAQAANLPNTFGFKNRLINGGMVIDQRNAGVSVTPSNQYVLDRWYYGNSQASKGTIQQNAGSVTPPSGFSSYLGFTSSSAYSVLASDEFFIRQPIEGFNFSDFNFGTANAAALAFSFWVRSSLTGTFAGVFKNSAQNRSYPFTYTISAANTWEQKTVTITGDTAGTWVGGTNGIGLYVVFALGAGSSRSGTAGSWQGVDVNSVTGATSVVGTNGATFYITGVQLEKGSTATSFDYRPYGTELALCQRYLPVASGASGSGAYFATGLNAGASSYTLYQFKVTPRVPPTNITVSSASHFGIYNGVASFTASGVAFNSASYDGCFLNFTGGTLTAGTAVGAYYTSTSAQILFNGCEL